MRWPLLVLASLVCPALAQPQESLITELEATQRRSNEKSAPLREREQAADKAMELRAKAIAAAAEDDSRLPGWLVDSAVGELARLARDGSDTAALFAIPLPAQRLAVTQSAQRAVDHLTRAAALLDLRLAPLQATPPDDPVKAQLDQDRSVRVPFFASRARVLLAACTTGKERTTFAQAAFELVGKLSLSTLGPESIRRVIIGAALLMRADPPAPDDLQTAIDEFGWVLTNGGSGATATTRAEAWFGLIAASAGLGKLEPMLEQLRPALVKEPFLGPDNRPDSLLAVLATDSVSRAWADRAFRTRDRALLDRAVAEQQSLLRRQDLAVRADSLRPLVYQKLHLLGGLGTGLDLPPAIDLATAIDAARDQSRREEAIKRLRAVADAPDAGDFAADALWELAVLHTQTSATLDDTIAAVDALVCIARDFSTSPRASEAIAAALAHAQALARESVDRGPTLYREALKVAITTYPKLPGIDTWRYEYGRVLAEHNEASTADLKAARDSLLLVPAAAPISADAVKLLERVQARILDDAWSHVGRARAAASGIGVQELCRNEVLPEARRAVEWATSNRSSLLDRFRADMADALTECGDSSGRATYEDLAKRGAEVPGGWPRLRLGLARSQMIAGETAAAFATLRDLATALDAPAAPSPAAPRTEVFWHAWTLMLEELSARNADGARTGTIRANIKRLESIDPSLGGEPWRSRLGRVRDKAKG